MMNTPASDWRIRYVDSDPAILPITSQESSFMIRSEKAGVTVPLSFSGLTLQVAARIGRSRHADRVNQAAQASENINQLSGERGDAQFWSLTVHQPFSANDVDYAHGIVAFYSIGLLELAAPGLEGAETILRFHAQTREKGRLFSHPGHGLPFDDRAWIPRITSTAGLWRMNFDN